MTMAENLLKRPAKGILKTSSSFEQQEAQKQHQDIKWDEMNILQTLHPPDKDYGHMKVEEPKTPFSYYHDDVDGEHTGSDHEAHALDPDLLSKKIAMGKDLPPKAVIVEDMESEEEEEEVDENETEEERAKRTAFEYKRKIHYNEFYAVKLARKLMQHDVEEDVEGDHLDDAKDDHDESVNLQKPDAKEETDTTHVKTQKEASSDDKTD